MAEILPPVILLMGPTASGKSTLAIDLAQALDTDIISVDSAQVFKGMDIGTAKPDMSARGGIKHHLIDILDPSETFSTGQFLDKALTLMQGITEAGKIPLLTGGTMLYFNALLHGLAELPKADPELRARLQKQAESFGNEYMHMQLQKVDVEAAQRIHPNDPQRVQRALEVFHITGRPLSELQRQAKHQAIPYQPIKLVVAPKHRSTLHQMIADRFHAMLNAGLIDEVMTLYQRGDLDVSKPAIRSVGYRQVWAYLEGQLSYPDMVEKGIIATRQLAKRQFTWLRRELDATWIESGQSNLLEIALHKVHHTIKN